MEAYQRHEITTGETLSLLFSVLALLDALADLGESLRTYGLHVKMTHDNPGQALSYQPRLARKTGTLHRPSQHLSNASARA